MTSRDPTRRFSHRVEDYVRYRPHYPDAIVRLLAAECGLSAASVVADVGSGTGILSALFLSAGCRVFGVEPNREMREAGERLLQRWAVDYAEVDHDRINDDVIAAFYAPGSFAKRTFPNRQTLDAEGARGRLESSSYTPSPGDPRHAPMLAELQRLFDRTNHDGVVTVEYETLLYFGRLTS